MDEDDSRVIIDDTCVSQEQSNNNTQIKQYKKIKLLGVGAYGKAYLVESDDNEQIKYVMKILPQSESAQKEAQILQNLTHDNIIQYIEAFTDNKNRLCLIMEYANNGTLGQFIKGRTQLIPETQIIDWFTQLCLALQCVHSQKILHRDIKSENIFINNDIIKLGDFGIARSIEQTLAKTFIGTPYYISPEIVQNQPYSYKSDIWSLGVLLYEMCTLKYPFLADSLPALATKIMKGKFQPISAQVYSQNMKNLITQLLQIDQQKRPTIEQILQTTLILNRAKQLNLQQQQIIKIPVQPMQKKQQHQVIIKNDEYSQQKRQSREELQKQMREDLQKKRSQQKPQEVVISLFGSPKTKQEVIIEKKQPKKKIRDIPVQIYLPFYSQVDYQSLENEQQQQQLIDQPKQECQQEEQQLQIKDLKEQEILEQQQQEIQIQIQNNNISNKQQLTNEILLQQDQIPKETQVAQKPKFKLTFEKAEKLRKQLEEAFGTEEFLQTYKTFKQIREQNSLEEIAKKYGPAYSSLVPNVNQETLTQCLSYLFLLLEFDIDQQQQKQ